LDTGFHVFRGARLTDEQCRNYELKTGVEVDRLDD
jgi:hypothetical protein